MKNEKYIHDDILFWNSSKVDFTARNDKNLMTFNVLLWVLGFKCIVDLFYCSSQFL